MHGREVIEQVNNGYRMPKPVNHPLPDSIYRLMIQCWDATPEKRPTFEFLNHYFESFNVTSEIPYLEPPTDWYMAHHATAAHLVPHHAHYHPHNMNCAMEFYGIYCWSAVAVAADVTASVALSPI